ncbi:MAG: hypothetical protein R2702_12555 [Acidimicrobiales bacterium]
MAEPRSHRPIGGRRRRRRRPSPPPTRRNAFDLAMCDEVAATLDALEADERVSAWW